MGGHGYQCGRGARAAWEMPSARRCRGTVRELRWGCTQLTGIAATRESRGELRGAVRDSRGLWRRARRAAGKVLAHWGFVATRAW